MDFTQQERYKNMKDSSKILKDKTVAIVGLGGLGSHSSEYLTRMGVGHLILIDDDVVEESNLPRQGLYEYANSQNQDFKVEIAKKRLKAINPNINIDIHIKRLTKVNVDEVLNKADIVLDGTDNLKTRYLINDYCFSKKKPWIYASATADKGTVINFIPDSTPCFRCVFGDLEEDNASCDIDGIILPALTWTTSIQSIEAIKFLLGKKVSTEEIRFNIWTREESSVDISIFDDEQCLCKQPERLLTEESNSVYMHMICSGDTIQVQHQLNSNILQKMAENWGFVLEKANDLFMEFKKGLSKKIVIYRTGKIVFHNLNKKFVQKWLNQKIKEGEIFYGK